jgi:hypothetical protein
LTSTLSPERSDLTIYVIDFAVRVKIPCKDMVAFIDEKGY